MYKAIGAGARISQPRGLGAKRVKQVGVVPSVLRSRMQVSMFPLVIPESRVQPKCLTQGLRA
jgi:hypothetical protein